MKKTIPFTFLLCGIVAILNIVSCKQDESYRKPWTAVDYLTINQYQTIGSHNSYRIRTYQPIYDFVTSLVTVVQTNMNPEGWDYSHLPLDEQFSFYNVRSVELDIFNDPVGGQFYFRKGNNFVNTPAESGIAELQKPGMKLLHIPDFDYLTHYFTFKDALIAIKNWSDLHPNHIPIVIHVESKEETVADAMPTYNFTKSIPFDAAAADNLDKEIKSVFGNRLDKVITPDNLRGTYATVSEAAKNGAWPLLGDARGKVIFAMQGPAVKPYLDGHPLLEGRAMFVYAKPGNPETAFVILNNPISSQTLIQQYVAEGYMVRTRADADTKEARTGNYSTMNAAFSSGAQIISTDYYQPDPRGVAGDSGWTNYVVKFPGNKLARINSFSAPQKVGIGEITE